MKVLPQKYFTENLSINIEFLNNRTENRTAGTYLVPITEFVNHCQQRGTGTLLIINNYILGLRRGNQCFFLLK